MIDRWFGSLNTQKSTQTFERRIFHFFTGKAMFKRLWYSIFHFSLTSISFLLSFVCHVWEGKKAYCAIDIKSCLCCLGSFLHICLFYIYNVNTKFCCCKNFYRSLRLSWSDDWITSCLEWEKWHIQGLSSKQKNTKKSLLSAMSASL